MSRMLQGELKLHDIDDVEAAANHIITDFLRHKQAYLREHDREDLTAYLIGIAWELSLNHKPHITSFSQRFYRTGTLRVVDFYRARWQDLRSPKPSLPLSLDAPAADTTDGPGKSLIETLAGEEATGDTTAELDSEALVGRINATGNFLPTPTEALMGRRIAGPTSPPPHEPERGRDVSEIRSCTSRIPTPARAA